MALHPHGHQDAAARRADMLDASHDRTEPAAARAMRAFLRQVLVAARATLAEPVTAAGETPPIARELFTLGQARGWWDAAVGEQLVPALRAVWRAGYTDTSTTKASDDAVADYVARVKDRLSPAAVPGLPEHAFATARTVLAQELSTGASIPALSARLAAEFSWDDPAAYWRGQKRDAQNAIDAILDPLGQPGDYAREHTKRHDPRVAALREQSNEATRRIDDTESTWKARATRIARTETTGAFNAGAYQAYHDEGAAAIMWVATLDSRTRRTHKAADRQVRVLGQPFQVGHATLLMPGDPSGPAAEVINCRCTTIAADVDARVDVQPAVTPALPTNTAPTVQPTIAKGASGMNKGLIRNAREAMTAHTLSAKPSVLDAAYKAWGEALPQEQRAAFTDYQVQSFRANQKLRAGDTSDATLLDAAMADAPRLPTTIDTFRVLEQSVLDGLQPGDVFTDQAFLSTTVDADFAAQFAEDSAFTAPATMKIRVGAGQRGAWVDAVSDTGQETQGEFLMPRGTHLAYVGKSKTGEYLFVVQR